MRIGKNYSIFQNLIPIEKKIKVSQIHVDSSTHSHAKDSNPSKISMKTKKLKVKSILNTHLLLPSLSSPKSPNSTTRATHSKRPKISQSSIPPDPIDLHSQIFSPVAYQKIIENDLNRILRNFEKTSEDLKSPLFLESKRLLTRIKKNLGKLNLSYH
jgi:hypothetical protein